MPESLSTIAYLMAGVLFILSLAGLSTQKTARRGNAFGIAGMLLALGITALGRVTSFGALAVSLAVGSGIGALLAMRVEMTSMPELVAVLHSFVGLAAVLVGVANYLGAGPYANHVEGTIHAVEVCVGVFVGSLTFTGSVLAFGKLRGLVRSKPLLLPGRHLLNVLLLVVSTTLGARFLNASAHSGLGALLIMAGVAGILGVHLVLAIGGADMPVVVSMLNSYSGWAAAAAGFMLENDLLIITGALVGSSGAILSYIMCRAMNRSFLSVIFGGFGVGEGKAPTKRANDEAPGEVTAVSAVETAALLSDAKQVVIVPGYGMAVAHAQHPVCRSRASRCALRSTLWPGVCPGT
jgi:NAD(P) transhydrogenase subunit beta